MEEAFSSERGCLVVPPRLVQTVVNILNEASWFPLRACVLKLSLDHSAPRGVPVVKAAAKVLSGERTGKLESWLKIPPALAELLKSKEVKWDKDYVLPGFHSGDQKDFSINPESHNDKAPCCKGHFEFTFIELFAGIGGFKVGLEHLGGKCVFASEIDDNARAVYKLNHGHFPDGDIRAIDAKDIPDHDILTAGFPCQPFTRIGVQDGLNEAKGQLFWDIVRILKCKRPRAFLLENVPGLLTTDDGNALKTILTALDEEAGYVVRYQGINSRILVPQNRNRIYFVGIRKDLDRGTFRFPFVPDLKRRFEDVNEPEAVIDRIERFTLTDDKWLKVKKLTAYPGAMKQRLVWPDLPTRTIISHYRKDWKKHSQLVPRRPPNPPRFFTDRECARLQGFPESFQMGQWWNW